MRRDLTATLDWSLARLTRLTELTLHGTEAIDVMLKLLRSPATPALPASLVTLRQDNREGIHFFPFTRRASCVSVQALRRLFAAHTSSQEPALRPVDGLCIACNPAYETLTKIIWYDRTEPLAAVTLPVLELRTEFVELRYDSDPVAVDLLLGASRYAADLPHGFRALWLHGLHPRGERPAGRHRGTGHC